MTRVVLCDDHAIVRAGLLALLEKERGIQVVGEAGSAQEVVRVVQAGKPDVVLLDLSLPGASGLSAIPELRAVAPSCRILVLSMHAAPESARSALRAGAHGYLVKGSGLSELLYAIRTVATGQRFVSRELLLCLEHEPVPKHKMDDLERLTPREREILQLIAEGHTNRQVAAKLGLSQKTVDTHRTNLMRKLDLHDAQSLTRFAVRHGLISTD